MSIEQSVRAEKRAGSAGVIFTDRKFLPRVALAPDEGAGGAAAGAAAGTGAAASGGALSGAAASAGAGAGAPQGEQGSGAGGSRAEGGQSQGAAAAAMTGYRPEGLPDHLAGASDRETIDKLYKAVDGFRQAQGERGMVPKTVDEYKFEATDKLKPYVGNLDKDPMWKGVREDALAAGITDKEFARFMPAVLARLVEGGGVAAPMDANAELMKLAPGDRQYADDKERLQAGAQRLNDNIAWVDGLKAQKGIPEAAADYLAARLTDDRGAHQLVDWLRGREAKAGPALDGNRPAGAVSDSDLKARNVDPRNDPSKVEFDRSFAQETDRLYRQRYG